MASLSVNPSEGGVASLAVCSIEGGVAFVSVNYQSHRYTEMHTILYILNLYFQNTKRKNFLLNCNCRLFLLFGYNIISSRGNMVVQWLTQLVGFGFKPVGQLGAFCRLGQLAIIGQDVNGCSSLCLCCTTCWGPAQG